MAHILNAVISNQHHIIPASRIVCGISVYEILHLIIAFGMLILVALMFFNVGEHNGHTQPDNNREENHKDITHAFGSGSMPGTGYNSGQTTKPPANNSSVKQPPVKKDGIKKVGE